MTNVFISNQRQLQYGNKAESRGESVEDSAARSLLRANNVDENINSLNRPAIIIIIHDLKPQIVPRDL